MVKSPMTLRRDPISIIATISGTAVTPLITALQYNALIGSSGVRFNAMPTRLATISTP